MFKNGFWKSTDGFTSLQTALTFAIVGLVASMTALPYFEKGNRPVEMIGQLVTGEEAETSDVRRYTITHSVLQRDFKTGCTVYEDGTREGSC